MEEKNKSSNNESTLASSNNTLVERDTCYIDRGVIELTKTLMADKED